MIDLWRLYSVFTSFQNDGVTEAIQKVAESFKCKPIEGKVLFRINCLGYIPILKEHRGSSVEVVTSENLP